MICKKNDKGVVLIILLWVLVALSLIALSLASDVRVEMMAVKNEKDMLQGYYMARAGIMNIIYKVVKDRSNRIGGTAPGLQLRDEPTDIELGLVTTEFPTGKAVCEIEDESGKINVTNQASEKLLHRLLSNIGIERHHADIIVDSILDWVDPDNLTRPNGAEEEYYSKLPVPYKPKNRPFDVLEELLLVRGITPEIFYGKKVKQDNGEVGELYGLVKYVTIYPTFQINVNAASVPVLMSVEGINAKKAQEIYEKRKIRPFKNPSELSILPEQQRSFSVHSSNIFSIKAMGMVNGSQAKRVVRAVVNVNPGAEKLRYRILYWNENPTY